MNITGKEAVISTLKDLPINTRFSAIETKTGAKLNALKESEAEIFVFSKRSRKYGRRYDANQFSLIYGVSIKTDEDINLSWHRRLNNAVSAMEESGLWVGSNIYNTFVNLKKMTYQEKKEIERLYWVARSEAGDLLEKLEPYITKYPFLTYFDNQGRRHINTDYLFELSECRTKTMYFGDGNSETKKIISNAIAGKQNLSFRAYTNYDVSFKMDFARGDGIPRAWYSEEYKGCGNGHYYLCLGKIAVFCEDD